MLNVTPDSNGASFHHSNWKKTAVASKQTGRGTLRRDGVVVFIQSRVAMFPCYLVILESQPSLNNEGADESSSSLISCLNKEPGCVRSSALESAGGLTCHCM